MGAPTKFAVRLSGHTSGQSLLVVSTPLRQKKYEEKQQVLPISGEHYTVKLSNRMYALLTLCESSRLGEDGTTIMKDLFGLTPAEAKLADLLVQDYSIQDAAHKLGRSIGTARIQLRAIFEKTETNRQSSLVRLLMSLPA